MISRRLFLALSAAAAAARANAQSAPEDQSATDAAQEGVPFDRARLEEMARDLASRDYAAPERVPQEWIDLDYDAYRAIWFRHDRAIWYNASEPFEIDLFAPGMYFPEPVGIHLVQNGRATEVPFDLARFDTSDQFPDLGPDPRLGYSGLRVRGGLVSPDVMQEFAVFQGASYFRAIGAGESYGLSARGLALSTGEGQEEFPRFASFWLETPPTGADSLTVHALLDSPSVAGAYTFVIAPGAQTVMDVQVALYPRVALEAAGIAPLTSMFLFDATNRDRFDDFRAAVHDSDGLMIVNGNSEELWRPLANPRTLQLSSFVDEDPAGFGLMQRSRALSDFSDLEAQYHMRPSLWITPKEPWGRGAVQLVEIPSDKEIYDNIVAFWRPAEAMQPGQEYRLSYRMDWGNAPGPSEDLARVIDTREGLDYDRSRRVFAIDYGPHASFEGDLENLSVLAHMSGEPLTDARLERHPGTGGVRMSFSFDPNGEEAREFRAQIAKDGRPVSEIWLYRWTP